MGFAEMMKYSDLTDEKRDEYLDIVIETSRLSKLSTSVLNLSKVEKLRQFSKIKPASTLASR